MAEELDVPKVSGEWYDDRDRYLARLRARTAGLVRRHRETIARVGDALFDRKTLSAAEIDALMQAQEERP